MGSQEDTVLHPRLLPPLPLKRLTPPWSQSSIFTSNARLSQFPLLSPKNESAHFLGFSLASLPLCSSVVRA